MSLEKNKDKNRLVLWKAHSMIYTIVVSIMEGNKVDCSSYSIQGTYLIIVHLARPLKLSTDLYMFFRIIKQKQSSAQKTVALTCKIVLKWPFMAINFHFSQAI